MEDILKSKEFPSLEDYLIFSDSHRVSLPAGDYKLKVTQNIDLLDNEGISTGESEEWKVEKEFIVEGEQFHLAPDEIISMNPPRGSEGDYWTMLPHIVLNRSTLPWERTASSTNKDSNSAAPWLALIVIHPKELEKSKIYTQPIQEYLNEHPSLSVGSGVKPEEVANFINVDTKILPSLEDLKLLAHVRQREALLTPADLAILREDQDFDESLIITPKGATESYLLAHETASIIANRLPHPGGKNVVHLVSLEGLYGADGNLPEGDISLVSLYQWQFYCQIETRNFSVIMRGLNKDNAAEFRLPLTPKGNKSAPYLEAGFVPLKHHFREGSQSWSWYHGPLIPVETNLNIHEMQPVADMHIRHADQLVVFDKKSGLFDVSYAAAWQLGRLLTLQNTKLALAQLAWKKRHQQTLHAAMHQVDYGYDLAKSNELFRRKNNDKQTELIANWLDELTRLQHIPFQYLIPDEGLLPPESIRFFSVDNHWIECLRDGAFSIGRVLEEGEHQDQLPQKLATKLTGLLIRSEAVSGWPQLVMKAYTDSAEVSDTNDDKALIPIRKEILGKNILLVLFDKEIQVVDFKLPPEHLHYGFDLESADTSGNASDQTKNLVKNKRNIKTGVEETTNVKISAVLANKADKVINFSELLEKLDFGTTDKHAATLAIQLMNGNDVFRFSRTSK